jgi:hypothetical protein
VKLPDFLNHAGMNDLRVKMRDAPLGNAIAREASHRLTEAELEILITGGIDIKSLDDVRACQDGTLAFKDRRVVLYIRDISEFRGYRQTLPKFHVAECRTLQEMRRNQRFGKYVVAARMDGQFQINRIGSATESKLERLAVCKNCLDKLQFNGYRHDWAKSRCDAVVETFTLSDFFRQYPRDIVDSVGAGEESTAPLNDYTGDFGIHAFACKQRAAFRCEKCRLDLSSSNGRRFLHAHHVNGMKPDNSIENLRALCIRCHAEEPNHAHMKSMPHYAEFVGLGGHF